MVALGVTSPVRDATAVRVTLAIESTNIAVRCLPGRLGGRRDNAALTMAPRCLVAAAHLSSA